MKKEIKISTIVIDLGDKKLELNMEQAKELMKVLNDTFPEKEIQYVPSTPIVIRESWPQYHWWVPTVTHTPGFTYCSSSCGGIGQTSYSGTLNLALSS